MEDSVDRRPSSAVTTEETTTERRTLWQRLWRIYDSRIRFKIIAPYLVLTLVVAILGTYVVTQLFVSSVEERLNNQLLKAGRVVSTTLAEVERGHLKAARSIAYVEGLIPALEDGDLDTVRSLALPSAASERVEYLLIVGQKGQEILHVLLQPQGEYEDVVEFEGTSMSIVQSLLASGDAAASPRRIFVRFPSGDYYYCTASPIDRRGHLVGVIVVGTSMRTLLARLYSTALADVIIYLDGGQAVASTFYDNNLDALDIPPSLYDILLHNEDVTVFKDERPLSLGGNAFRLARGPLRVGNDTVGAFAVALPLDYIMQTRAANRNIYALLFTLAMGAVILLGNWVAQRITDPVGQLADASRSVAEGDLTRRTGIQRRDEIGVLASAFDKMTERLEERTHELEEALGRLRAILASIGDGVVLEDTDGEFHPLNKAAENLLEELAAGFLLSPLRELMADYEGKTAGEEGTWVKEHRRFEVGRKVITVHSADVRTEEGERLGTVIVMRDVTAEVAAEQLKDAFITHVSHELRTPLTAIKGYGELLLSGAGGELDDNQRNFLETICRHTDNLVAMINELLDFSEMEAGGRLRLQRQPVLLNLFIEEILEEYRPQMEDKGLTLHTDIPASLPIVEADTRRLRWAIINLVRNAMQYTPAGGHVTVSLRAADQQVIFEVSDTGIGISPQDQERLFDRFYRVTNVTEGDVRGLGLGLYVAKAIIEAHNGTISVTSAVGKGSTFTVTLPAMSVPEV